MSGDEVISAVERRFGLRFQPGLRSLIADSARELVAQGMARHLGEVAVRVAASAEDDPVVQHMRAAASVCETYFFRAPEQLRSLRDLVLTRVLPEKRERSLRIWSAGCATGEEAYTLAALFADVSPRIEVSVVGTDMNEVALHAAETGRYRRRSFRRSAPEEHARWFEEKDGLVEVRGELRKLVSFARFNIATDPLPPELGGFDVVVCRNVLIYLRPDLVPQAAATLASAAASPAVLALGSAEYGAARHAEGFQAVRSALFVRGCAPVRRVRRSPPPPRPRDPPVQAIPPPPAEPVPPPPVPPAPQAVPVVRGAPSLVVPEDTCGRARAAADAGDYAAAEQALLETIRSHPTAALAYHLLGSVHAARGALDQAIDELQRATFLDPHLAAAQLALGQALARAGRTAEARRHLRGALRAIESQLDHEMVPELGVTAQSARRIAGDALRQLGERA